ncbi:DEAD/DEAH box helicase [Tenacibaculum sp. SG-28]|uniref:DEAD/DEAH box helicase n=1 Tax=Tenacibaculum sp. SG-28 TaxID=754426 RepID=UPI000CF40558|nr:DEAD/DEAH box helicase [Tenacibaculum sp. SG-28]PQJ23131.1 DEAD/DEAH box helicase [Tenacibaculum sp. SG-28]
MSSFKNLGVQQEFIRGLKELKITTPTAIQEKVIPILLNADTDFIGLDQTGTGKTAGYGIPILQKVKASDTSIQFLVLSPTRELVQQIKKQLFKYSKYSTHKIFIEAVYGGEKIDKQIANLSRVTHIVVATPGRLLDLIERGTIDLQYLQTLILDEADEMLSMGFKEALNRILKYTSGNRKTWLFSATMPEEIRSITKKYMHPNAEQIQIDRNIKVNTNITHRYVTTTDAEKLEVIVRFLERYHNDRGIIFTRTKAGAQKLAGLLKAEGFSVAALEGNMQQREREKVMRAFKKHTIQVLVATDVAARGIDIANVSYIIHHQLPENTTYYTHRSGRTARAGNKGVSLALIAKKDITQMREIEKSLQIQFIKQEY